MSELLAEFFRGLLLALANPAAVNHDVTFIGNAINFDSTEVKFAEVHRESPRFRLILSLRTRRGSEVRGCRARSLGSAEATFSYRSEGKRYFGSSSLKMNKTDRLRQK